MTLAGSETAVSEVIARWCRQPEWLEPVASGSLPPPLRALLSQDGTVTTLLWALTGESVAVGPVPQALGHELSPSDPLLAELTRPQGPLIGRHIVLRGAESGRCYCLASSLLVPGRLPPEFLTVLRDTPAGIGAAMNQLALETRRDFLWQGLQPPAALGPQLRALHPAGALVRHYHIIHRGLPVVSLRERFPLDLNLPWLNLPWQPPG